jgi:TolB-like protein/class 3 adenylate cyclase
MPPVRRLTAILAADVAGYSRLMGVDEEGAHERLQAHLQELVNPKIAEHRGRIVKNTGDGFLAEFPSVVDAVRCAVEVQRGMADREPEVPAERRIEFRIGINLGDVIVEEHDIFGDGVNVAARLEALAEPGGICVAGTVRDHIGDRLPYAFEDLGEQQVKNIARPVRVYVLRPEGRADVPSIRAAPAASSPPSFAAPRLSIVVLPFINLSNDPDQEYFADGITEDLTTDLSRIADMFVISRGTAFSYRNRPVSAKKIREELRVRYVLEGSVRRSGNRVRVNAQLADTDSSAHLWAERFEQSAGDLLTLQDEITGRIAVALNLELISIEAARRVELPGALDYIFRGRAASRKPQSSDNYEETVDFFERALALDPRSVEAQSRLAIALTSRVLDQMTSSKAADIARAETLVGQALDTASRSPLAHFAKGQLLRVEKRYAEAIPEYEMAITFDRNWVNALGPLSECKLFVGAIDAVIPMNEQAIRLSPRDPFIAIWYFRIGVAHLLRSRIDDAIVWLERARGINPELPYVHSHLASAYALRGEIERSVVELAEARRLSLDGRYSSLAQLQTTSYYGVPKIHALYEGTYFAGLRKAGMPEE